MTGELRFGVIGAGYWGPHLIRNLAEIPQSQLCAVADLSIERLQTLQRGYPQVALTLDYRELFNPEIDAVVVATPVSTHYAIARAALQAGKHVLVEKPMVRTSAEALDLLRLAEKCGLTLMVGHTFEYNPAVVALRAIMESGELGRVLCIDTARLNLGQFRSDVNVLWDLCPHDLSIINFLLDSQATSASARGYHLVRPDIHDVVHLDLRYPGGIPAHVHVSWLEPRKERRITVVGDQKMVIYDDVSVDEKIRIYDKGVTKTAHLGDYAEFRLAYRHGGISIPAISSDEPLKLQLVHFCECILEHQRPRSDGWSGLRVVRALESAETSLQKDGAWVLVDRIKNARIREGTRSPRSPSLPGPLLHDIVAVGGNGAHAGK